MPFCPQCQTEYKAGFTECSDCGELLVDELPPTIPEDIPPEPEAENYYWRTLKFAVSILRRNKELLLIPLLIVMANLIADLPTLHHNLINHSHYQSIYHNRFNLFEPGNVELVLQNSIGRIGVIDTNYPNLRNITSILYSYNFHIYYHLFQKYTNYFYWLIGVTDLYWLVVVAGIMMLIRSAIQGEKTNSCQFIIGIQRYAIPFILTGIIVWATSYLEYYFLIFILYYLPYYLEYFASGRSFIMPESYLYLFIHVLLAILSVFFHLIFINLVVNDITIKNIKQLNIAVFRMSYIPVILSSWSVLLIASICSLIFKVTIWISSSTQMIIIDLIGYYILIEESL